MWKKLKDIFTYIGFAVVGFVSFWFAFLRKTPRYKPPSTPIPDPKTDPDMIKRRQENLAALKEKLKAIEERHKEENHEKTISDLISDHNDLYND